VKKETILWLIIGTSLISYFYSVYKQQGDWVSFSLGIALLTLLFMTTTPSKTLKEEVL